MPSMMLRMGLIFLMIKFGIHGNALEGLIVELTELLMMLMIGLIKFLEDQYN